MQRHISDADIQHIYREYVLVNNCPEYLERYTPLPINKNVQRWKWEGKAFPRVITILEFARMVETYAIQPKKLLMYNGHAEGDPELAYIHPAAITRVDYDPASGKNDLQRLDLTKKDFDFILFSQTLEHAYNPLLALANLYNHLLPGGYLFTSVPVVNIPHSTPFHHYTGFTPVALGTLCYTVGFDIIEIGQWGNLKYINMMFNNRAWPDYLHLPKGIRSRFALKFPLSIFLDGLRNQFDNPVDTWILAQKPS